MTYEVLVPFLKGFHLAYLASHLDKRDNDGWKLTDKAWLSYLCGKNGEVEDSNLESSEYPDEAKPTGSPNEIPAFVKVSEHLKRDLIALGIFLEGEAPPVINDQSADVRIVRYGFGDASGTGFGSTIIQTKQGLKYRVGVWGNDEEGESSNFKELENVVTTIEEEAAAGSFNNSSLFFFTDNTTVEAALYKGNSSSRKLFDLVVRFRRIQLVYGMQVMVSHVSGKRMIQQGTDGVSRGNMKEGVGSGLDMLQFIPLHQGAIERHGILLDWIKEWAGKNVELLSPTQWFTRGHDQLGGHRDKAGFWRIKTKPGVFLWAPPPAAAKAAIEQLRRALIKRQKSTHIIVIPRLMTTEWLKQLYKSVDLLVSLPAGVDNKAWPSHMFEPLTLAFIFPFLSVKPWKRRGSTKMCVMARELQALWKDVKRDSRSILRKFFQTQRQLGSMPECMVRRVLYFER